MGGDGGVIAVNRRYMRGAGTADATGDYASSSHNTRQAVDPAVAEQDVARMMTNDCLTNQPLHFDQPIVVCPYGWLYQKETAVEALLKRKSGADTLMGTHVRGLKDLKDVRFHVVDSQPTCPVTDKPLNGKIVAFALLPGNPNSPNVVSERALTMTNLMSDYEPYDDKIRLAPTEAVLVKIKEELEAKRKAKKKKRKRGDETTE